MDKEVEGIIPLFKNNFANDPAGKRDFLFNYIYAGPVEPCLSQHRLLAPAWRAALRQKFSLCLDFISRATMPAQIFEMPLESKPRHPLIISIKMTLAVFAANVDFSQWSLSIAGIPVERISDNTGIARMFEAVSAGAGRLSSAATGIRKIIGVRRRRKIDLSEKTNRGIYSRRRKSYELGSKRRKAYELVCYYYALVPTRKILDGRLILFYYDLNECLSYGDIC